MFLIVGLGNTGKQYDRTRHNIGFDMVDYISKEYSIDINRTKFKGLYGEGNIKGEKVILLKPQTFMNLSGDSIIQFMKFYKLTVDDMVVIYDDISMDIGRLRIREKGSAGGHNGIKSIIQNFGSDVFPRVKVGVGAPEHDLVSHVLGKFPKDDYAHISGVMPVVVSAIEEMIKTDVKSSMNKFNGTCIDK
ncbi:aminoacyl-tRNA hydrolase [uncultured Clostridium sp.]|uniref:aminoacyl-tRNA hydrolase n=1 Tax=uncultured Clostridium sp. TaxID=59620 RepID=UPI00262BE8F4|nr:aminoacyl-tRNA hydrolase [uncultured Clostridium sp.]